MSVAHAIFAAGCFWGVQATFDNVPGVISTEVGYTGGRIENPTYEQVCSKTTGHTEAVEIIFDPEIISFKELVEIYWQQTDPTDAFGQFEDRGDNYRPVIFYFDEEQKRIAQESKQALQDSGIFDRPIVTQIEPAQEFYVAELYHQEYYKKNPANFARNHARRAAFLKEHWDD